MRSVKEPVKGSAKGAARGSAKRSDGDAGTGAVKVRAASRARRGGGAADPQELLTLGRARDELGLDYDEFEIALQVGEVRTVVCGPGVWKVPRAELARLQALEGARDGLLERLRLVSSEGAAEAMGIGRDRFVRLARAGCLRPVRWYVNQYRAVVWLYLAREAAEFADRNPALLTGRMPGPLRKAGDAGADLRARGWRARRIEQLVRDAADPWEEAAAWAALLGPEIAGQAVPDPYERAHLYRLRAALPPGRPGRATPEQTRSLTTADAPDEIAAGLLALAEALGRARAGRPVPRPSPAALPSAALRPAPLPPAVPPSGPPAETVAYGGGGPADAAPPGEAGTGAVVRRGLRRLLGLRSPARPDAGVRPAPGRGTRPPTAAASRQAERRPRSGRDAQSSPTSVSRITARPSSSEAARSTSAEMPQP